MTAIASHFSDNLSRIALAESDLYDPSLLYFSIYDVTEGNQVRLLTPRVKIDLPEYEHGSPGPAAEETKTHLL